MPIDESILSYLIEDLDIPKQGKNVMRLEGILTVSDVLFYPKAFEKRRGYNLYGQTSPYGYLLVIPNLSEKSIVKLQKVMLERFGIDIKNTYDFHDQYQNREFTSEVSQTTSTCNCTEIKLSEKYIPSWLETIASKPKK